MDQQLLQKCCRVCGDRAQSYHFNGLTCSPCKMFFKRNAHKANQFKCFKNETCTISHQTRKACPACRLQKCFSIGMTMSLIQQKNSSTAVVEIAAAKVDAGNLNSEKNERQSLTFNELLEHQIERRFAALRVGGGSCYQDSTTTTSAQQLNRALFFEKRIYSIELNDHELRHINEAILASTVFSDESRLAVVGAIPNLVEAFNAFSHYVKRIVEYCNRIGAFKAMKQTDRLALLKQFYFELLAIRFSFLYDATTDGYPVIENEQGNRALLLRIGLIDDCRQYQITTIHRKFKSYLHIKMEDDTIIRDLIMAQFLFKPFNCVSCPEFVRNQYFLYCYLLKRYLENKYKSVSIAAKKYTSLMALLEDFSRCHYVREIFTATFFESTSSSSTSSTSADRSKVSDVLAEVFDIAK